MKRREQREVTGLRLADVDQMLGVLAVAIEPVAVPLRWRPQLRDPEDELGLEAVVNGRADALVTHNVKDFLDIAPHFGIQIARPGDLLEELRS